MRALYWTFYIFVINAASQDVTDTENKIQLCEVCTCSEIPEVDDTYVVLNVQCSELDRIESVPDLNKVEWPENPNGLRISAAFEGLGLTTLSKLPPNPQVETLRFSNNAIKAYWPDPFSDLPSLKRISFYQNELSGVTEDLFTKVNSLEDLDFSLNKLTDFNFNEDFPTLHTIKRLNLQSNKLKKIPVETLQRMTSLEDLDLSKNGIYDLLLQRTDSYNLGYVKRLSLNGNRIRSITKEAFPANNNVELLDLSNNMIEVVEEESFLTCTNLKELNLGQNNITFVFALPPTLQIAMFKINTLYHWPQFPAGITYIDLSYNRLSDLYDENNVKFDNLEVLAIAGNQIKEVNIETKLPKLFSLDLSFNLLEDVPKSLNSQNFPNLEELHLDGNPLESIYFKNILALRNLHMTELTRLTVVGEKAFSNVIGRSEGEADKNCFSLFLYNCPALSDINEGAFDGTSLCRLDISKNKLSYLPQSLLPWSAVDGVNLQGNPWNCSCRLQWLLDDLLPLMYTRHSSLLGDLRCSEPRALSGLRMVHWYNWTEHAMCDGFTRLSPSTENLISRANLLPIILTISILVLLFIAIGLFVYLVRTRRRHRARAAALQRKRNTSHDAKLYPDKEQYAALNRT